MTKHLTSRQIERYHEGALDQSELIDVDEHLVVCAKCRRELNAAGHREDKFFSLKDETASDFDNEVVTPSELNQKAASHSSPPRLSAFRKSLLFLNSPAVAFGAGALAMLIVVVLVWLVSRAYRTRTGEPQVVQSLTPTPTPEVSPVNGLQTGASPSPSPSPQILLALNDGAKQVGIDAQGNLVGFDDLPPASKEMVKTALISQQAANLAAVSGLGGQPGVLRGGQSQSPGFAPISPVGKVIFSTKPTLRWSKLDGATEYRVEIYDSSVSLVASSPPLTSNSWNVANDLERGEIYSWHVTATKDGAKVKSPVPPSPEAKFKTLDSKQSDALAMVRKSHSGSHLALGVLYAQAGLLDEAETEFTTLLRENPQSEIAKKLLSNVQTIKKTAR